MDKSAKLLRELVVLSNQISNHIVYYFQIKSKEKKKIKLTDRMWAKAL